VELGYLLFLLLLLLLPRTLILRMSPDAGFTYPS